jgi:hypothetical protein
MADKLKASCPLGSGSEDEQAEHRERQAIQSGPLSQRFEVGTQTRVCFTSATRDTAVRRARRLAQTERTQAIVRDTMARRGAAHLWLFREDGTVRRIVRRVGNVQSEGSAH